MSKIAIIGAGVSGLTAAHNLAPQHEVVLYEAAPRLGGHANTLAVVDPAVGEIGVDTGFIVLNDRNYPCFEALLGGLGVPTQDAEMGLSIATQDAGLEFAGTASGLFAQPSNLFRPRFLRMLADQLRFNRDVRALIGRDDSPSIGEFMRDGGYSRELFERIVMPEISAVWSADPTEVETFPVGFLAEFLDNHGQLSLTRRPQWKTVVGGSRRYVAAIAVALGERVRSAAPVRRVERTPAGVAVEADGCETELYDEVVLACHSDQALGMIVAPTDAERDVLGAIAYQPNEAALHTDPSPMPLRRRAWASWNFHLRGGARRATMTYWMNRLQQLETEREYFVTLNATGELDPARIIDVVHYEHPVITHAAVAAQRRWAEVSGRDRLHFCGAYWRWGFHEDGCWSALRACESLVASGRRVELAAAA